MHKPSARRLLNDEGSENVMAITINSSVLSQGLTARTGKAGDEQSSLFRKMASGKSIESARDNAALLAIASRMSSDIRGLNQAHRNANDGVSMLQVVEGGLSEIGDNQQRMRELSVQAANGTLTDSDRANIQTEIDQLQAQNDSIVSDTQFNGQNVLASNETIQLQVGPDQGETTSFALTDYSGGFAPVDVTTQSAAMSSLATLDADISTVSQNRADAGAMLNQLESSISNLANRAENTADARSRIEDADMAQLSAESASASIRAQAGVAVQLQARQSATVAQQLISA